MSSQPRTNNEVQPYNEGKAVEVRIPTETGELLLSPTIVRKYLVNGQGAVTDQEIMMFLGLCRYQRLNPFLREAYLIKYGSQPAAIVVGKEAFLKRSRQCPDFRGHKAGVIVMSQDGGIHHNDGFVPEGQKLVGGWAEIYMDNWPFPLRVEVDLKEYLGRKSDGSVNRMWQEKPATMIRKVALVQALREAFPSVLGAMYTPEEVGTDPDSLPTQSVVIDQEPTAQQQQPEQNGDGGGADPREQDSSTRRARRNKFDFEGQQYLTCGVTPEQLRELRLAMSSNEKARAIVTNQLKTIGYAIKDGLTYLKMDEAAVLLEQIKISQATLMPHEPATEEPAQQQTSNGPATVTCPLDSSTRNVAEFCHQTCKVRKDDGWCPAIDEPPMAEGGVI